MLGEAFLHLLGDAAHHHNLLQQPEIGTEPSRRFGDREAVAGRLPVWLHELEAFSLK